MKKFTLAAAISFVLCLILLFSAAAHSQTAVVNAVNKVAEGTTEMYKKSFSVEGQVLIQDTLVHENNFYCFEFVKAAVVDSLWPLKGQPTVWTALYIPAGTTLFVPSRKIKLAESDTLFVIGHIGTP